MSAARWSRRRDGSTRTTMRLAFHIPREMVEWLMDHVKDADGVSMSEAAAVAWVRRRAVDLAGDYWLCLGSDLSPYLTRYDESGSPADDDIEHYTGPDIVVR